MNRKMVFAILLVTLSMLFALAGCGGSDDAANSEYQPEQSAGTEISFQTTDLDGNAVNSEELFAENEITMINIWGTYCGPCIEEMPELEAISTEYADKGVAVVGLLVDVPEGDDTYLEDAESIMDEAGATFMNLRAWDGFEEQLETPATPITYFVDSQGKLLGEPIVGAYAEEYKANLDKLIAGL